MPENRRPGKLAVILHADVAGSTALVQQDEHLAHERIQDTFRRFSDTIAQYHGHVRELRGDALLAEFERASDAVCAALDFQHSHTEQLLTLSDEIKPTVRIGVSLGEVVLADDTVTGAGVVLAQRVEQLAEPGGLCITAAIHEALPQRMPLDQESLGEQQIKGFDEPVRVYRVRVKEGAELPAPTEAIKKGATPVTRWSVIAAVVILICGGGLLAWYQPWAPDFEPVSPEAMAQPLPAKPSIAVLPFDDLSTGEDQDYLSDAISEGIITELSQFSELFVIARNSSFQYRDKATDVRDIAAELGVHYVLEGSQQKDGDRLRVTVQLIDALAGNHMWAERYDRSLKDLFAVQDEIVQSVASTTGAKIAFRLPPTGDLDRLSALHHHLKAREYIRQFTREGNEQARLANLAAIEADPTSPFGYIGLTFVYIQWYWWGWTDLDSDEVLTRARQSAEKALELDPNNYDAHFARAYVHTQAGEQAQAIARFEKSIELNPSATNVMASLAEPLVYTGRVEEAIELLHRAMRLDPHHPDWFKWNLAWAQWHAGDCDTALSTMQSMAKIPNMARRHLATIYVCLGRQEEAEATIAKFLENEPDDSIAKERERWQRRYKDPAELERWLDALRTAGLPENPPLKLPDKPSIAVLPFTNMSEDPEQEYFADGITDDLITDLSKLSGLFVIARNSSFTYKGKPVKVQQVAEDLGVRYVLEGSVRRAGGEIRINAQLIDALSGGHLWAERYDSSMKDVFAVQDEVTQNVVAALEVHLTEREQAARAQQQTDNPEAYDAFLRGRTHYGLSSLEDSAKAIAYLEDAIQLDPNYARAHGVLAAVYYQIGDYQWAPKMGMSYDDSLKKMEHHLNEALKNPTPLAHKIASKLLTSKGQTDEALAEARHAVALEPNDATGYDALARIYNRTGRPAEGLEAVEKAMRLDPQGDVRGTYSYRIGESYFHLDRFEEAAAAFKKSTEHFPDDEWTFLYLAAAYGHLGRKQEARSAMEKFNSAREKRGRRPYALAGLDGWAFPDETSRERLREGLREAGVPPGAPRPPLEFRGAQKAALEIEGATTTDLTEAKTLFDRGIPFVDVRGDPPWKRGHIAGAVHLHVYHDVTEAKLSEIVAKDEEVVIYACGPGCGTTTRAVASAVSMGFKKVYFFREGFPSWKAAGYPIEVSSK